MHDIDALRAELDTLNESLVALIARRQEVVRNIGRAKLRSDRPTRDFAREREVLDATRAHATKLGVRPDLAAELMSALIRGALTAQEQDRVAATRHDEEGSALVIGGAGKMGRWFSRFLHSQGYRVTVCDPSEAELPWPRTELDTDPLDYDRIVVATPLRQTNDVLLQLAARKPRGTVFDVGSLKTPLRSGLKALVDADVSVTSIHPMFGPDTNLLSGSHVIFIDLGNAQATEHAKALFSSTMATSVDMGLDEHDRAIAYVLGLSHALNIAFFTALANTGAQAQALAKLSSTTFDAQLGVAGTVARENPELYYDIQTLNAYGDDALQGLVDAATQIRAAVHERDARRFTALMDAGRDWFNAR